MHQVTRGAQAVDQLKTVLEHARKAFPIVRRQTLIFLPQGGTTWRLGFSRVSSVAKVAAPLTLRYDCITYDEQHVSIEEALAWFSALATRSEWIVDGKALEITSQVSFSHTYETQKPYIPFSPCHYIRSTLQTSSAGGWHYDPLVTPGQPVYPNINTLLQDKFGVDDMNGRTGNFELYLPAHEARINSIRAKGRTLHVAVLGSKPSDELLVRVWARAGRQHMSYDVPLTQDKVSVRLATSPQYAAVYLVDKAGTLLDAHTTDKPLRSTPHTTSKRELLRMIEEGESTTLEFKNYAKHAQVSQAADVDVAKIATHLVAFANTQGGTLLLGVHDDGSIKGVDDARKTKDKLTEAANDVCDPRLTPELFTVTVGTSIVVGARIDKSTKLHHAGSIAYVRRNATTRKATAGETTDIIKNTNAQRSLLGGYGTGILGVT